MASKQKTLDPRDLLASLAERFRSSSSGGAAKVGLELETLPLRPLGQGRAAFLPLEGPDGLYELFEGSLAALGLRRNDLPSGLVRFTDEHGGHFTFEPGGQLEYSSATGSHLAAVVSQANTAFQRVSRLLESKGALLAFCGLNPFHGIEDLPLQLSKDRYLQMDRFFQAIGPYGQQMMRLSASLQVNLDFQPGDQNMRSYLAANLLGPLFTAAFANSPLYQGRPTPWRSYRGRIWLGLDASRSGFPSELLHGTDRGRWHEAYCKFALDALLMRPPQPDGSRAFAGGFHTFASWLEQGMHGTYPDWADWEEHLTTLFPELRPRGFMEIRYLDGPPRAFWPVPAVLLQGLLATELGVEQVLAELGPYRADLQAMRIRACQLALQDGDLARLAKRLLARGLSLAERSQPEELLTLGETYLRQFTSRGRCPADDLLELAARGFSLDGFLRLEGSYQAARSTPFMEPV
jgi:glutamate--cysteine ligase